MLMIKLHRLSICSFKLLDNLLSKENFVMSEGLTVRWQVPHVMEYFVVVSRCAFSKLKC